MRVGRLVIVHGMRQRTDCKKKDNLNRRRLGQDHLGFRTSDLILIQGSSLQ